MIKEETTSDINEGLNKKFLELLANNLSSNFLKNENEEIVFDKVLTMEYDYNHVMIETSFSFINAIWNGNTAFIKINDNYYWMDQHNWMEEDQIEQKKNLCIDPEILNEKWTTPIR